MLNFSNIILRFKAKFVYNFCRIFHFYKLSYDASRDELTTHTRDKQRQLYLSWVQTLVILVLYYPMFKHVWPMFMYDVQKTQIYFDAVQSQELVLFQLIIVASSWSTLKMLRTLMLRKNGKLIYLLVNKLLKLRRQVEHATSCHVQLAPSIMIWLAARMLLLCFRIHKLFIINVEKTTMYGAHKLGEHMEEVLYYILLEVFYCAYETAYLTFLNMQQQLNAALEKQLENSAKTANPNCGIKTLKKFILLLQRMQQLQREFQQHFEWIQTLAYWGIFEAILISYKQTYCIYRGAKSLNFWSYLRLWGLAVVIWANILVLAMLHDALHNERLLLNDQLIIFSERLKRSAGCSSCRVVDLMLETCSYGQLLFKLEARIFGGVVMNREFALNYIFITLHYGLSCAVFHFGYYTISEIDCRKL